MANPTQGMQDPSPRSKEAAAHVSTDLLVASNVAILLAGGKGTRLRQSGRGRPKPLLTISDEPIINFLVRSLLKLDGDHTVSKIYILLTKKQHLPETLYHPESVLLNLKADFELWEKTWFWEQRDRIDLVFEEDLPVSDDLKEIFKKKGRPEGAVAGLALLLNEAGPSLLRSSSRVLVAAADNFLPEEDLGQYFALCTPDASVNAYKDLGDPAKIRDKFGCITTEMDGATEWMTAYAEKPSDPGPKDTKASVALYCFPRKHFALLSEYVTFVRSQSSDDRQKRLGAPGFFMEWLAGATSRATTMGMPRTAGVKARRVQGRWFDIGDPADLRIASFWHTHSGRLETVEDLTVARETGQLDDNSFLLVRRLEIDPETRTIRIWHSSDDMLCSLRPDGRKLKTVQEIAAQATNATEQWERIRAALEGRERMPRKDLESPLLLSAGVFLFDSHGAQQGQMLSANRALVPFLQKDIASNVDRRRVTTPAGRVDSLDVQQVCLDEMREEFIFYGVGADGLAKVFCLIDDSDDEKAARLAVLAVVRKSRLQIPGINLKDIDLSGSVERLTEPVHLSQITPNFCWKLETFLNRENSIGEKVERKVYSRDGFAVIPDEENHTLEFRIIRWGNITGVQTTKVFPTVSTMQIGRLRGIADGDGYHRIPFVLTAEDLIKYGREVRTGQVDGLRSVLQKSQREVARILAVGDRRDGRFEQFETALPFLFTTTSVNFLLEKLEAIVG